MAQRPDSFDVLIAGGSYVGLALALALSHESGGDLHIAVAAPAFPRPAIADAVDARGSALSRGSLNLLAHLGIWPALEPHAQTIREIALTDSALDDIKRAELLSYPLDGAPDALPAMVIVENQQLGAVLMAAAARAPAVHLLDGATVQSAEARPDHAIVTFADTKLRPLSCRLMVAADGRRSRLREQARITTSGYAYEQTGIVAIVEPELPHQGRALQHFLPAGPFALLPMTRNRVCVTWTETASEAQRILSLDAAGFRAETEKRFGFTLGHLKTISGPQSWPLEIAVARTLAAPRLAIAGDAAHAVHPIAGQGLNLGFRDVAALTEAVIDTARLGLDIGSADVLARYERARRFDNLASAVAFDALNRTFAHDNTLVRSARSAALGIADRLPSFKQWLIAEAVGDTETAPRLLRRPLRPS